MRKRCFQCGSILDKEIGPIYIPELCPACSLEFTKKQENKAYKPLKCKECGKDIISCYSDGESQELCLSCYKRTVLKEPPTQVYRCYGCGEDIGHEGICKECDFVLQNNKVNKMIERLLEEVKGLILDNSYHFREKKEQDKLRNFYFNTWEEINHYFKEPYPRANPTPKDDAQEYFDYLYGGTDCGAK